MLERAHSAGVVHFAEGRVFKRIEKNHLALDELDESEQQVELILFIYV